MTQNSATSTLCPIDFTSVSFVSLAGHQDNRPSHRPHLGHLLPQNIDRHRAAYRAPGRPPQPVWPLNCCASGHLDRRSHGDIPTSCFSHSHNRPSSGRLFIRQGQHTAATDSISGPGPFARRHPGNLGQICWLSNYLATFLHSDQPPMSLANLPTTSTAGFTWPGSFGQSDSSSDSLGPGPVLPGSRYLAGLGPRHCPTTGRNPVLAKREVALTTSCRQPSSALSFGQLD